MSHTSYIRVPALLLPASLEPLISPVNTTTTHTSVQRSSFHVNKRYRHNRQENTADWDIFDIQRSRSLSVLAGLQSISTRDVRKPNFGSVFKNPNWTEPKPKGQTRNFSFRGFSQNRTCLIQIVNIWAIFTKLLTFFMLRTLSDSKW